MLLCPNSCLHILSSEFFFCQRMMFEYVFVLRNSIFYSIFPRRRDPPPTWRGCGEWGRRAHLGERGGGSKEGVASGQVRDCALRRPPPSPSAPPPPPTTAITPERQNHTSMLFPSREFSSTYLLTLAFRQRKKDGIVRYKRPFNAFYRYRNTYICKFTLQASKGKDTSAWRRNRGLYMLIRPPIL